MFFFSMLYYKMNSQTIVMCVVALILGMLLSNMLKNVCGCKNVVEGWSSPGSEGTFDAALQTESSSLGSDGHFHRRFEPGLHPLLPSGPPLPPLPPAPPPPPPSPPCQSDTPSEEYGCRPSDPCSQSHYINKLDCDESQTKFYRQKIGTNGKWYDTGFPMEEATHCRYNYHCNPGRICNNTGCGDRGVCIDFTPGLQIPGANSQLARMRKKPQDGGPVDDAKCCIERTGLACTPTFRNGMYVGPKHVKMPDQPP
jgi:hypothetical protein